MDGGLSLEDPQAGEGEKAAGGNQTAASMCTGDQAAGAELFVGVYKCQLCDGTERIQGLRERRKGPAYAGNKKLMEPMRDKFIIGVNVCKPIFNPIQDLKKAENLCLNTHSIVLFSVVSVERECET